MFMCIAVSTCAGAIALDFMCNLNLISRCFRICKDACRMFNRCIKACRFQCDRPAMRLVRYSQQRINKHIKDNPRTCVPLSATCLRIIRRLRSNDPAPSGFPLFMCCHIWAFLSWKLLTQLSTPCHWHRPCSSCRKYNEYAKWGLP